MGYEVYFETVHTHYRFLSVCPSRERNPRDPLSFQFLSKFYLCFKKYIGMKLFIIFSYFLFILCCISTLTSFTFLRLFICLLFSFLISFASDLSILLVLLNFQLLALLTHSYGHCTNTLQLVYISSVVGRLGCSKVCVLQLKPL